MTNLFPEQSVKLYKNGKTYAQNVKDGTFIPIKHLQNHKELVSKVDKLEQMLVTITEKLSR
ncbi:MAG: hypothetical protein O3A39_06765 [Proteobacteria bacterium]|nr:hypothetical protein [Pseudomonadota bacterium]